MNIGVETLDSLRKLVRELQEENEYLKKKLRDENIAFSDNRNCHRISLPHYTHLYYTE